MTNILKPTSPIPTTTTRYLNYTMDEVYISALTSAGHRDGGVTAGWDVRHGPAV